MNSRFLVIPLIVLATVSAVGAVVSYWVPKSQVLPINDSYVGYYRGLGMTDESGYFGKNWFRIVVDDGDGGYWEVHVNGVGYSPYRGFYSTGELREVGLCMVEKIGTSIVPDRHDILDGLYYNPEGQLISEIHDGTGKQILLSAEGKPSWELDLINGKYSNAKLWYDNGQLAYEKHYQNGKEHGISVSYYSNGQLRQRSEYKNGTRIGITTRYTETGEIESQTDEGT